MDGILATNGGIKLLSSDVNQITLDGLHQHAAVDILHKTGEHPWNACHLCMHFIMCRDQANIKQAEAGGPQNQPYMLRSGALLFNVR